MLMFKAKAEMPEKYREVRDGQQGVAAPAVTQINIHLPPGMANSGSPLVVDGRAKMLPDEDTEPSSAESSGKE